MVGTVTERLRRFARRQDGFTLLELIVVLALITTLSAIAFATYKNTVQRGREAVLKENLYRMRDAIDQHYADKGKYPQSLEELVSAGYLRKLPKDPMTESDQTWQGVPAEPDASNPSAEPGVYDVKSGSEATAIDGTLYNEW
jgi:general secretion pathway protein G